PIVLALAAAACGGRKNDSPQDSGPGTGTGTGGGTGTGSGTGTGGEPDASLPDAQTAPPHGLVSGVTPCPTPAPAPAHGARDATAGTGTAVLIRGDVLGDGVVYKDGGVLYDGDTIIYVGCDYAGQPAAATASKVDCAGAAISPGLINAHNHL